MAETGVEFAGVSYALPDGRRLIASISLQLQTGTTTAILGRSGSGKTTLLRMVNALVMPTSGAVLVGGKSTLEHDPLELRRSIGYVIQETGHFPHMTVERNAGIALELANTPPAEKLRRTAEVLALVGLDSASLDFAEFRARYPWQLSGGQRQRVGLARALAADPGALLMDEALYLAQRVIFLEAGEVVADLAATDVLHSQNHHVRGYVNAVHRATDPS